MKKKKPFIIIISGPSGVGKGSIIKGLIKRNPKLKIAISATTRLPRPQEKNKNDYYFIEEKLFIEKIKRNEFVEWAEVHKKKYGTLKSEVDYYLNAGYDVILEIDIQGALQVKKHGGNIISIFITPPSFQDLIDRLHTRNTEAQKDIDYRLKAAGKELNAIGEYDYIVVNNDIETAINDILEIVEKTKIETI
ncbi:MAG: guanylate kinase [Candidatus Margulisiibacteriota bacterium]